MEFIRSTASAFSFHQQRQIRSLFGILETRFDDRLTHQLVKLG